MAENVHVTNWTPLKQVCYAALASLLVLLALESALRIWNTIAFQTKAYRQADGLTWYAMSPEFGWAKKPNYNGVRHDGTARTFDANGYNTIDTRKIISSSRKRVVFLGDSRTFGFGVPAESTFAQLTEEKLSDVDCINFGVPGYSSYQGLQLLCKDGLELHPDIAVVAFGYNDRLCVSAKENADGRERFLQLYAMSQQQQIVNYAEMLYLTRSLKRNMIRIGLLPSDFTGREVPIDSLPVRVGKEDYRRNLSCIVDTARNKGIEVVFLVLEDNPVQTEFLYKGVRSIEQNDYERAINYLKTAQRSSPKFSLVAASYLSKAYEKAGRREEAMRAARFNTADVGARGGPLLAIDTEYSQIMREVAQAKRVDLVDTTPAFNENTAVFLDECHFDVEGHRIVAGMLADVVKNILARRAEEHSPSSNISAR